MDSNHHIQHNRYYFLTVLISGLFRLSLINRIDYNFQSTRQIELHMNECIPLQFCLLDVNLYLNRKVNYFNKFGKLLNMKIAMRSIALSILLIQAPQ